MLQLQLGKVQIFQLLPSVPAALYQTPVQLKNMLQLNCKMCLPELRYASYQFLGFEMHIIPILFFMVPCLQIHSIETEVPLSLKEVLLILGFPLKVLRLSLQNVQVKLLSLSSILYRLLQLAPALEHDFLLASTASLAAQMH